MANQNVFYAVPDLNLSDPSDDKWATLDVLFEKVSAGDVVLLGGLAGDVYSRAEQIRLGEAITRLGDLNTRLKIASGATTDMSIEQMIGSVVFSRALVTDADRAALETYRDLAAEGAGRVIDAYEMLGSKIPPGVEVVLTPGQFDLSPDNVDKLSKLNVQMSIGPAGTESLVSIAGYDPNDLTDAALGFKIRNISVDQVGAVDTKLFSLLPNAHSIMDGTGTKQVGIGRTPVRVHEAPGNPPYTSHFLNGDFSAWITATGLDPAITAGATDADHRRLLARQHRIKTIADGGNTDPALSGHIAVYTGHISGTALAGQDRRPPAVEPAGYSTSPSLVFGTAPVDLTGARVGEQLAHLLGNEEVVFHPGSLRESGLVWKLELEQVDPDENAKLAKPPELLFLDPDAADRGVDNVLPGRSLEIHIHSTCSYPDANEAAEIAAKKSTADQLRLGDVAKRLANRPGAGAKWLALNPVDFNIMPAGYFAVGQNHAVDTLGVLRIGATQYGLMVVNTYDGGPGMLSITSSPEALEQVCAALQAFGPTKALARHASGRSRDERIAHKAFTAAQRADPSNPAVVLGLTGMKRHSDSYRGRQTSMYRQIAGMNAFLGDRVIPGIQGGVPGVTFLGKPVDYACHVVGAVLNHGLTIQAQQAGAVDKGNVQKLYDKLAAQPGLTGDQKRAIKEGRKLFHRVVQPYNG